MMHSCMLALAFVVVTPISIVVSRYGRQWRWVRRFPVTSLSGEGPASRWFDLHLAFQLVAQVAIALGVVLPFCFLVDQDTFNHFPSLHSWLGLGLIVAFCVAQPILGLPSDEATKKERQQQLWLHSILGRALVVTGFWCIYLGFDRLFLLLAEGSGFETAAHAIRAPLMGLMAAATAALIALELWWSRKARERREKHAKA